MAHLLGSLILGCQAQEIGGPPGVLMLDFFGHIDTRQEGGSSFDSPTANTTDTTGHGQRVGNAGEVEEIVDMCAMRHMRQHRHDKTQLHSFINRPHTINASNPTSAWSNCAAKSPATTRPFQGLTNSNINSLNSCSMCGARPAQPFTWAFHGLVLAGLTCAFFKTT